MDDQTKAELVAAANLLIRSPNAHILYQTMLNAAPLMARHKDVQLTGEAEPLNTLARLKVSHPDTFSGIIELAERRRADAGYDPLVTAVEDRFDKTQYMQAFMEQKRQRQRRAADIENMQRGERDKLIGRSRLDFMQRQSSIWKEERDALIERAKASNSPRRMTKAEIALVVESFWKKVDERLDLAEEAVRGGKRINPATSLAELEAILRHDPYA
jgi:hypothetical protein